MKKFIISPPFGNWIDSKKFTSVLGSFTWKARPGLLKHALKTFRPYEGGWINKIGLRNKGIRSIPYFEDRFIYSVVGLEDDDWERILYYIPPNTNVEVNLGCPNVHEYGIPPSIMKDYCTKFNVIAKLSPDENIKETAAMCIEAGVQKLHVSNTLSDPNGKGGISGRRLFRMNLDNVYVLSQKYPGKIIAGGGIYDKHVLRAYEWAGATNFSLSTVWLTPWRVR